MTEGKPMVDNPKDRAKIKAQDNKEDKAMGE